MFLSLATDHGTVALKHHMYPVYIIIDMLYMCIHMLYTVTICWLENESPHSLIISIITSCSNIAIKYLAVCTESICII